MRFYVIIAIALAILCIAEAAGRKKIVNSKKLSDVKAAQNTTADPSKSSDKPSYPKKATSLKKRPTKSSSITTTNSTNHFTDLTKDSKDVNDIFKNLPADDLEFIKELDKQFKLHGDKLKIKVEQDNATSSSKNSKRTIEGDLGYGYEHNGYTYDRPKFMFYPYSQKDIPSNAPSYYPQYDGPSVTIEPSYSYELKPQTYVVQHAPSSPQIDLPHSHGAEQVSHAGGQAHQQDGYQEPVIILRIPGPTKYASHLQTLLQQYLEIRAAQYLRILQESESRKHHEQSQQYNQELDNHQQHYEQPPPPPAPAQHVEAPTQNYALEGGYSHQAAPTPQPISYPAIDDVYQTYKQRQHYQQQAAFEQEQQQQHQQQQHIQENPAGHSYAQLTETDGSQQYYYPNEHQQVQGHPQTAYQQVYVIAMAPNMYSNDGQHLQQQQYEVPQQPIYVQEEEAHYENQAYDEEQSGHLATSENNPRSTHTKINFNPHSKSHSTDQLYPLPSIQPFDRHEPSSTALYHQQYYQQSQPELDYQQNTAESAPHQDTVSITQRPFNYHAHPSKIRNSSGRKRATAGVVSTTTATPATKTSDQNVDETEKHLQKIRQYVQEKLGAERGSAVEFKTTQIVKG